MRVQMVAVNVRCHQYLMTLPRAFGKLQRDFVGCLGSDPFIGRKALLILIEKHAVRLTEALLCRHKLRV